jgi:opacity protein-like surface antigen
MKRIALLAAAFLAACISQGVSAAELALKAEPPSRPTWDGFYVGVHAGAAWESAKDWTFVDLNNTLATTPLTGTTNVGAVGGIQGGYNWQFAQAWVLGVGGDISWASFTDARVVSPINSNGVPIPLSGGGVFVVPAGPCGSCNVQMNANTEWLSSVRGRLGFALCDRRRGLGEYRICRHVQLRALPKPRLPPRGRVGSPVRAPNGWQHQIF